MSNKFTILIVEDENNIASFMTTILTANNFNVIKAKDGAEAFMMITSYCPDVILLDLGLPDIDGQRILNRYGNGRRFRLLSCRHVHTNAIKWQRLISAPMIMLQNRSGQANFSQESVQLCGISKTATRTEA
jgi:CheY-like chemotaxis protein